MVTVHDSDSVVSDDGRSHYNHSDTAFIRSDHESASGIVPAILSAQIVMIVKSSHTVQNQNIHAPRTFYTISLRFPLFSSHSFSYHGNMVFPVLKFD